MNEIVTAEKEAEIRRENIARLTSEAPVERRNLTVDSLYEMRREQRDEAADEAARQALQTTTETEEPVPDPPAQLPLTVQELRYFDQLHETEAALQAKWDSMRWP